MNNDQISNFLGDLAAENLASMETEREQFHERLSQQAAAVDVSADRILDRFSRRREKTPPGPVYSPAVIGIANTLTQFPQLVDPIRAVIYKILAKMNAAMAESITPYMDGAQEAQAAVQAAAAANAAAVAAASGTPAGGTKP